MQYLSLAPVNFPRKSRIWAKHFARSRFRHKSKIIFTAFPSAKTIRFFHSQLVKSPEFINFILCTRSRIRRLNESGEHAIFPQHFVFSDTFKFKTCRIREFHSNNPPNVTLLFIRDLQQSAMIYFNRKYNQYRNS